MNEPTPRPADRAAAPMLGAELSAALARQTASWMDAQREWVTSTGTIVTDWLNRQRQALDLSSRSIQRVWECRSVGDLLQAQQQWASDCLQWTAAELRAAGRDANTMTQQATSRLCEEGRSAVETLRREAGRGREAVPATVPAAERAAAK